MLHPSPSPPAAVPLVGSAGSARSAGTATAWIEASVALTGRLLLERNRAPLEVIAEAALGVSGVDLVLVALPVGDRWVVAAAAGTHAERLRDRGHALDGSPVGDALRTGRAVTTRTPVGGERRNEDELAGFPQGPCMVVPLRGPEGIVGAFAYCARAGQPRFRLDDLGPAAVFAGHATAAIGACVGPPDPGGRRILDLSDDLIQDLFASGVAIESVVTALDGEPARRLQRAMATLDDVIARLRAGIHADLVAARAPRFLVRPTELRRGAHRFPTVAWVIRASRRC
ncbi:MAG: GAF domain-containing protein [Sporichthyaceae bacterium]